MSFEKTGDEQPITIIKKCCECGEPTTSTICQDCAIKQQQCMRDDEINDS